MHWKTKAIQQACGFNEDEQPQGSETLVVFAGNNWLEVQRSEILTVRCTSNPFLST